MLVVEGLCAALPERVRGQLSDRDVRVQSHDEFTRDGQPSPSSERVWRASCAAGAAGGHLVVAGPDGAQRERDVAVDVATCSSEALEVLALAVRAEWLAALASAPAPEPSLPSPEPPPVPPAPSESVPPPSSESPPWLVSGLFGLRTLRPLPGRSTGGGALTLALTRARVVGAVSAELYAPRTLTRDTARLRIWPAILEVRASYTVAALRGLRVQASAGLGLSVLGRRTIRAAPGFAATAGGALAVPHALAGLYLYRPGRPSLGLGLGLRVPLRHPDFVAEATGGTERVARIANVGPWLALDLGAVLGAFDQR